jgi:hypothetical protein
MRWLWPDGFVGDDPASRRNARWLALALALIALIALIPAAAMSQGTLLQAGPTTQGHAPAYINLGQTGSQAVVLDSGPASGGGSGLGLSELNITARGTGSAPFVGQGTGPNGEVACILDAPANSTSGYHYLCFSANVLSGGLISYGAAGTATPQTLNFNFNGTAIAPVTCSGTPSSSFATVNGIVTHC